DYLAGYYFAHPKHTECRPSRRNSPPRFRRHRYCPSTRALARRCGGALEGARGAARASRALVFSSLRPAEEFLSAGRQFASWWGPHQQIIPLIRLRFLVVG